VDESGLKREKDDDEVVKRERLVKREEVKDMICVLVSEGAGGVEWSGLALSSSESITCSDKGDASGEEQISQL